MSKVRHDDAQRAAIDAPVGPVAILAGPGSGKTSTLVARIARLCAESELDPSRTLALCHTTKAAGELSGRLSRTAAARVTCSTIHAAAWRCVRANHTAVGFDRTPELVANIYPMLRGAARSVMGAAGGDAVPDIAAELEWARAKDITADRYVKAAKSAGRTCAVEPKTVAKVWRAYNATKADTGSVDFADTLELAARILTDSPVADALADAVDAVFVDEYQDIDPAQQRLIEAWLGPSDRLCVVGDASQAVFGFKGADVSYLLEFEKRWPGAVVVALNTNYRSTPQVVEWVNRLATVQREPLVAGDPTAGPAPLIVNAGDEAGEERALVSQLRRWADSGVPWSEMAVLHRFRATSARLEAALTDADIPHHVTGVGRFFDRPEVRAVLVPFGRDARTRPHTDGVDLLAQAAAATGWDPDRPPAGAGPARQRWEAVTALVGAAAERHAGLTASALLRELQLRAKAAWDLTPGGVTLATVHAAKGLEWDAVWVAGAVEGQMPSTFAKTAAELNEEANIAYVAVSRARRHLVISAAGRRHNGWTSKPSRYLAKLQPSTTSTRRTRSSGRAGTGRRTAPSGATDNGVASPAAAAAARAAGCARCGDRLRSAEARTARRCSGTCLEGESRNRYDALTVWRDQVAADEGVPAEKVAAERALFRAAVRGATAGVTGLTTAGRTDPPF